MSEEREEYKFDHFKNIDEVMHYFNYWYKEEDVYSINRYLSLKDFNYISNKYQELQQENERLKDNWNYIKKMFKEARQEKYISGYCGTCTDVDIDFLLGKMQELEKGSRE